MLPFTTIVAVDSEHLAELRAVWPTWLKFRPEIMQSPLLLVADSETLDIYDPAQFDFMHTTHDFFDPLLDCLWIKAGLFSPPECGQREKMLAALIRAPEFVKTPLFVKIDTDVVATRESRWMPEEWFGNQQEVQTKPLPYCFVASSWSFTKPANAIQRLDDWFDRRFSADARGVPEGFLDEYPRLDLPFRDGDRSVKSKCIIPYVYWGDTSWHVDAASHATELPLWSHDTYFWYIAERLQYDYLRVQMSDYGWEHLTGLTNLKRAAKLATGNA